MTLRRLLFAVTPAVAIACGGTGGDMMSADSGIPQPPPPPPTLRPNRPMPPASPAPVDLPAAPELTPCATGWREVVIGGATICEPWFNSRAATCADGEAHFPGDPGCTRVGTPCPFGQFPEGLPAGRTILRVSAGANPTGADGSEARPYAAIRDAIARATPNTIIAIGKGTYDEAFTLPASVTLWGACVAETILHSTTTDPDEETISVIGTNTEVRNLSVTGRPALRVGSHGQTFDTSVTVTDVFTRGAEFCGMVVSERGTFTASSLVILDTESAGASEIGRSLQVGWGSTATVRRAVIRGAYGAAVSVQTGAHVIISDASIAGAATNLDGSLGYGVWLDEGTADLQRVAIEDNAVQGVAVEDMTSIATIADSVIRGTRARPADGFGAGITTEGGGAAMITRSFIDGNELIQLRVGTGSIVSATDVVVRAIVSDTPPRVVEGAVLVNTGGTLALERAVVQGARGGNIGIDSGATAALIDVRSRGAIGFGDHSALGLGMYDSAMVTGTRISLEDNDTVALAVLGAFADLSHVTVRDTSQYPPGRGGYGVVAYQGAQLTLSGASIERSEGAGMWAGGSTTALTLEDVLVQDVIATNYLGGYGILLLNGIEASLDRVGIERAQSAGLIVQGAADPSDRKAHVVVRDLVVHETSSLLNNGGEGIVASFGAQVEVERVVLDENRAISAAVWNGGTKLTLKHASITATRERACAQLACPEAPGGTAIGAYEGGAIELDTFEILRNPLIGVQIAGGTATLREGEVAENLIGVNVQSEGVSLDRITNRVVFRDNARDLDSSVLIPPDTVTPLEGVLPP